MKNATIICGCTIGNYSFIGAGAVIFKNVPDYGLVVRKPAKQIGWVSIAAHRLEFNEGGVAICIEGGENIDWILKK